MIVYNNEIPQVAREVRELSVRLANLADLVREKDYDMCMSYVSRVKVRDALELAGTLATRAGILVCELKAEA